LLGDKFRGHAISWINLGELLQYCLRTGKKQTFFLVVPHLATYILFLFQLNEPGLGAGIDPGIAFDTIPI